MNVTVQCMASLFIYLSLNCLFYILRPLLCFSPFKFLIPILVFFIVVLYVLLCIVCALCSVLFLAIYIFITAVNKYPILSYRIVSYRKNIMQADSFALQSCYCTTSSCCIFPDWKWIRPVPVPLRSKAWVCRRSNAGIAGSIPSEGMDIRLLFYRVSCM